MLTPLLVVGYLLAQALPPPLPPMPLQRRPDTTLPADLPPKVTTFFELVRQEMSATGALPVRHPSEPVHDTVAAPADEGTAASPETAAVDSSAPPADEGDGPNLLLWSGVGLAGGGVLGAVAFSALALVNENTFWDPASPTADRVAAGDTARLSWVGAIVSGVVVAGGGVLALVAMP